MDGSLIGLPERLRIWHSAGVRYFFKPCPAGEPARSEPECSLPDHPELLPEPWSSSWRKIAKSPRFIFTYHDLGLDISGSGDPLRSKLWKDLLNALKWPPGTVAFWPYTAFVGGRLHSDMASFLLGATFLMSSHIIYFGENTDSFVQFFNHNDSFSSFALVVLPKPENVIHNVGRAKHLVFQTLQRLHQASTSR